MDTTQIHAGDSHGIQHGITNADKYVWATANTNDLFQMNLEQKIRRDLIEDLTIPSERK